MAATAPSLRIGSRRCSSCNPVALFPSHVGQILSCPFLFSSLLFPFNLPPSFACGKPIAFTGCPTLSFSALPKASDGECISTTRRRQRLRCICGGACVALNTLLDQRTRALSPWLVTSQVVTTWSAPSATPLP